jgi:peptide/nickel transport system substrate-binding protein
MSLPLKLLFLIILVLMTINIFMLLRQTDKTLAVEVPKEGGVLSEGIIGTPRFVNPVLAISDADRDLTMLVYSGLMRVGEDSQLIPDLAEDFEISEDGLCYTFTLKPNLFWPDSQPITTNDVVFTLDLIKNAQTKSPKRASWEGVGIEKIDDRNLRFCLPHPYAPFLENTTVGILPQHIWGEILPEQIPLSAFNVDPVGSGPYKIKKISRNSSGIITSYTLEPNKNFALEKPYIKTLILKFYPSEKKLLDAYQKSEVESLNAISPQNVLEIKQPNSSIKEYPLPRVFAVFFNQDNASLFREQEVRYALELSVDKERILREVLEGFGVVIDGPLPPGSLGALPATTSMSYDEKFAKAQELLEKSGWKLNEEENVLEKKKSKTQTIRLEFSLSTSNLDDLVETAKVLKENWEKLGAKVDVNAFEIGDLEQNVIRPRKYSSLLFGEVMGRDPDPFAFWHSSQRNDPGLNIALYANITVDKLLEDARTIFEINKREEKYHEFQKEIEKDTPAVFLYSPSFIYLLPDIVKGVKETSITTPSERFSQVHKWYIETKRVWKLFLKNN